MPSFINRPSIDDVALLDIVINERNEPNKTFFKAFSDDWKARYKEYIQNLGNPKHIIPSLAHVTANKTKFINLYGSPSGIVESNIIDVLEEHELSHCPFCSGLVVPDTLDHFLPKDIYPEYAILSHNLIPCCDSCNRAKSTKVLDKGRRIFFHPYYDKIKDLEIYILEIKPPYERAPDFELIINDELKDKYKKIAIRHLKELKIEERFRKYFKGQYKRLIKNVKQNKQKSNTDLLTLLNIFLMNSQNVDINYWDTIFYKSVLNNQALLDYLESIDN